MREIVVGVDGSQESRHALSRALHLAHLTTRPVVVAHVFPRGPETFHAAHAQGSELVDTELAEALRHLPAEAQVRFRDHIGPGEPGPVLTELGRDAGLVVLGTHEHGQLLTLLGPTVTHALHRSDCPVMVVPPQGDPTRPFRRVVVGVDGSAGSRSALRWGLDVAARDHAAVEILHVVAGEDEAPSDARAALRHSVPEVDDDGIRMRVVHGDPGTILSLAVGMQDLLVVGSRGTGRFAALVLGSVSAQVVTSPHAAVVVVRSQQERLDDLAGEHEIERLV